MKEFYCVLWIVKALRTAQKIHPIMIKIIHNSYENLKAIETLTL